MPRRPVRSRPIRLFLTVMLVVPLASLIALWTTVAYVTTRDAVSAYSYNDSTEAITASVEPLTLGLPAEREATYIWLLNGRKSSVAPILAARAVVNSAIPHAKAAFNGLSGPPGSVTKQAFSTMLAQLASLGSIRAAIDSGAMSPTTAFQAYDTVENSEFNVFLSSVEDRGYQYVQTSIGVLDGAEAFVMASRESALVAGAEADGGQMSPAARNLFASSAASRSLLMNDALIFLPATLRTAFLSIESSPVYQQYQAMEGQISVGAGSSSLLPVNADAWDAASGVYLAQMEAEVLKMSAVESGESLTFAHTELKEAILAGGAGLLAVIVSVILLVWFGRKVTRDLTRLDGSVRGMARERLPRVVEQLRRGDDVDVLVESPPPDSSTIREINRIADAFATVQRAAVGAAVDQASMRKGVSQVFQSISMRSQSLLHRQLGMLDSMERRASDPRALADLFRLDHLTTRMRRHAEGLIILSGATPGRGWRDPVPVVDVLRAAVAEVEDYVRVDVVSESRDLVSGNAVNDVVHLIAELIENATVFSPPNTRVEVRADRVGTGLVAEIEDRGLGLGPEDLADINRRLASPPEFNPADSEELGLFVVGQLAARHNIKVSLRPSVYGGITAILLLPFGVIVREEDTGLATDGRSWVAAAVGAQDVAAPAMPGRLMTAGASARAGEGQRAALPPSPAAPAAGSRPWGVMPMNPWPEAFKRAPVRRPEPPNGLQADNGADQPPVPPSPSAASARRPGPVSSGSHLGMPIRVPQASLAPRLRARRGLGWWTTPPEETEVDERPPEATRNMMTLMQQGWQRGRVDDLDGGEGAPGNGTD
jgi:signal transduction histidine kinase